jgi:hypothetical protein
MKTRLRHLIAVARRDSSTNMDATVPEFLSRPRPARANSQVLDVQQWVEDRAFPVQINRNSPKRTAALRLSFCGRFQYG